MGSHRRIAVCAAAALAVLPLACRTSGQSDSTAAPSGAASAPPVDHLAPGELAPGEDEAFGLLLPKGLKIEGRFEKTVYASGRLRSEDVSNYIRKRVTVRYVEMGAAATIFPRVKIQGGAANRRYTIEVVKRPNGTRLVVRDVTPLPPPPKGLDRKQLLDRAGFTPDGKVKNPNQLE